jgi:hypothetical protein
MRVAGMWQDLVKTPTCHDVAAKKECYVLFGSVFLIERIYQKKSKGAVWSELSEQVYPIMSEPTRIARRAGLKPTLLGIGGIFVVQV